MPGHSKAFRSGSLYIASVKYIFQANLGWFPRQTSQGGNYSGLGEGDADGTLPGATE